MIVRIWRTEIDQARATEYEDFARELSVAMFRRQPGFLGVLFLGTDKDRAVLTLWEDLASVEALAHSSTYQETSAHLSASGVLMGETSVEVHEVQGGFLHLQALAGLAEIGGSIPEAAEADIHRVEFRTS